MYSTSEFSTNPSINRGRVQRGRWIYVQVPHLPTQALLETTSCTPTIYSLDNVSSYQMYVMYWDSTTAYGVCTYDFNDINAVVGQQPQGNGFIPLVDIEAWEGNYNSFDVIFSCQNRTKENTFISTRIHSVKWTDPMAMGEGCIHTISEAFMRTLVRARNPFLETISVESFPLDVEQEVFDRLLRQNQTASSTLDMLRSIAVWHARTLPAIAPQSLPTSSVDTRTTNDPTPNENYQNSGNFSPRSLDMRSANAKAMADTPYVHEYTSGEQVGSFRKKRPRFSSMEVHTGGTAGPEDSYVDTHTQHGAEGFLRPLSLPNERRLALLSKLYPSDDVDEE